MTLQRSDLQGGGKRVRERSSKAIQHKVAHPSNVSERSSAGLYSMYVGLWTLTRTYSCTVRGWSVNKNQSKCKYTRRGKIRQHHHFPAQAAVVLTSEGPRTRLRCRVRP